MGIHAFTAGWDSRSKINRDIKKSQRMDLMTSTFREFSLRCITIFV